MSKSSQTRARPLAGAAQGLEAAGRTVLVMDEDANLRGLIETLLHRAGYQVLTAEDAATAQIHIRSRAADLVIMDLALPDMDGFTFLGQLKGDPATYALPVLVVTGYSDPEYRVRSSEMGAAGFLSKPFSGGDLVAEVGRILNEARHP
jgi:DNA-binding response OmpR family regulator